MRQTDRRISDIDLSLCLSSNFNLSKLNINIHYLKLLIFSSFVYLGSWALGFCFCMGNNALWKYNVVSFGGEQRGENMSG